MKDSELHKAARNQALRDIFASGSFPLIRYDKYIKSEKLSNPGFKRSKLQQHNER